MIFRGPRKSWGITPSEFRDDILRQWDRMEGNQFELNNLWGRLPSSSGEQAAKMVSQWVTEEAKRRLSELEKVESVVRETAVKIDMAELSTQAVGSEDSFYRADLTDPETRRALVEGTVKPLHAWVKPIGTPIRTPEDLFRMAREHGRSKTQEYLQFVLIKDGKVSDVLVLTSGAIDYISIDHVAFFSVRAYLNQTQPDEVVMVHNHPSHQARPSKEDLGVLKNFRKAMTAEGMTGIKVNGMVIDSNTFTWWGDDTGGEPQSFRLPTLPGDPKYVEMVSQRRPGMTPRDVALDIAREASQGNRMVFLGIDVAFQHVLTLRQPVSGEPVTREWLHAQARKYGVKFWALGIPDIATYYTVLNQLERDGLITQSLLQDPGYIIDVVYSGEEEGVTAPIDLLGTRGPTGEAEQRPAEWVHFTKVAPISTEGKLFAVLKESGAWEAEFYKKERERREKLEAEARAWEAEFYKKERERREKLGAEARAERAIFEAAERRARQWWQQHHQRSKPQPSTRPTPARSPYQVLGVDENASDAEIRQAYRKLARKHHPDLTREKGATKKFMEVHQAYGELGKTRGWVARETGPAYVLREDPATEYGRHPEAPREAQEPHQPPRVGSVAQGGFPDVHGRPEGAHR